MTSYHYDIYKTDGTILSGDRTGPFTLTELQQIVQGRIDVYPYDNDLDTYIVVCEDGLHHLPINPHFTYLRGNVIIAHSYLI